MLGASSCVPAADAPHVPVGDAEFVCRVDYAPSCTHSEADRLEIVDASGDVQLGFVRDGGFRLLFDGSGQASIREIVHEPPLEAATERCVRAALDGIRHAPFQGRAVVTGHAP